MHKQIEWRLHIRIIRLVQNFSDPINKISRKQKQNKKQKQKQKPKNPQKFLPSSKTQLHKKGWKICLDEKNEYWTKQQHATTTIAHQAAAVEVKTWKTKYHWDPVPAEVSSSTWCTLLYDTVFLMYSHLRGHSKGRLTAGWQTLDDGVLSKSAAVSLPLLCSPRSQCTSNTAS